MIPYFGTDAGYTKFMGFPMCQNRLSVPAWSYLIEQVRPKLVIEIGCYSGGLSCCLAIAMQNVGGRVWCCDIGDFSEELLEWKRVLPLEFDKMDALSSGGLHTICGLIAENSPCVVLCDDGNKPLEFNTYAPFLKQGDIIAAHDFCHPEMWPWGEINEAQVEQVCKERHLEPFMQDIMHQAGWLVRKRMI